MNILDKVFAEFCRVGAVRSHNEFSRVWLKKSARYMSVIRATGKEPSIDALVRLAASINRHKTDRSIIPANILAEAEQSVWQHIFEQAKA